MKKLKLLIYSFPLFAIALTGFSRTFLYNDIYQRNFSDTSKPNIHGYYFNCKSGPVNYNVYDGIHNLTIDTADTYCDFLFFYEDSTIFIFSTVLKPFDSIQSVINEKYFQARNKNIYKNVGRKGNYQVKNRNVYATVYSRDPSRFHPRIKEELKMSIPNSDTLFLLKSVCNQCKNHYSGYKDKNYITYDPPKKFVFISLSNKPDSSIIFNKKSKIDLK